MKNQQKQIPLSMESSLFVDGFSLCISKECPYRRCKTLEKQFFNYQ